MTIGKRLLLLLAVPLIALLGFGVFARIQLSRIEERSRFVSESQLAGVAVLGNISRSWRFRQRSDDRADGVIPSADSGRRRRCGQGQALRDLLLDLADIARGMRLVVLRRAERLAPLTFR